MVLPKHELGPPKKNSVKLGKPSETGGKKKPVTPPSQSHKNSVKTQ